MGGTHSQCVARHQDGGIRVLLSNVDTSGAPWNAVASVNGYQRPTRDAMATDTAVTFLIEGSFATDTRHYVHVSLVDCKSIEMASGDAVVTRA